MNTGERLNRKLVIVDDELPQQLLLLSQDKHLDQELMSII